MTSGWPFVRNFLNKSAVYALYNTRSAELIELKNRHPQGDKLHILQCNLADKDEVSNLCVWLNKSAGKLDVLVNNAAS